MLGTEPGSSANAASALTSEQFPVRIFKQRKHMCLTVVYVGSKEVGFPWAISVMTCSNPLAATGHTEEPLYSDP